MINGVRQLRGQADGQFTTSPPHHHDPRDSRSWHFVGIESATGQVVGAIRARVYDLCDRIPSVAELFAFSEVEIGDALTRKAICRALAAYLDKQADLCGRFYQIGGFAVAARRRGSALAPVLALAINPWLDRLGLFGGCTFATLENGVAAFDQRFGAFPLTEAGSNLPPFYCDRHRAFGQLLGTEPRRFEPRLTNTVAALDDWLRGTTAVVAE
jgi:hypothetical protein